MPYDSHIQSKKYFDNTASIYHQRSDGLVYDFSSLIFQRRNKIVKRFLPLANNKEMILDFGMGPGVFAKQCTENGYFYLGIDISNRIQQIKVEEPPKRKAGVKVSSVAELVSKLKNEAKVI